MGFCDKVTLLFLHKAFAMIVGLIKVGEVVLDAPLL